MERPASAFGIAVALLALTAALAAQGTRQFVPANLLIPQPPPSAPLSDWVESPVHRKVSQPMPGGAELRGWDYKPARPNVPILLFFNGNGMTVDRSDSLYRALEHTRAEVLVFG